MKYIVESYLEDFHAWSGGLDTWLELKELNKLNVIESTIEELFADKVPTETDINDFLWFERDFIAETLGYQDWEDLLESK